MITVELFSENTLFLLIEFSIHHHLKKHFYKPYHLTENQSIMKRILSIIILAILFVGCKNEPTKTEETAVNNASPAQTECDEEEDEQGEPSSIYNDITQILGQATEKMEAAKTTEEVVAVANQYYDDYWTYATEHHEEWSTQLKKSEKKKYDLQDKEFVQLLRSQYIEVGGTKEELRKLLHDLMIKCMQYDTALKASHEENTEK